MMDTTSLIPERCETVASKAQSQKHLFFCVCFLNVFFFFSTTSQENFLHQGLKPWIYNCHLLSRFSSVYALGLTVIRDEIQAGAKKEPKAY